MEIILMHRHYDEEHLAEVKDIMTKKGAPKIRAIWSECYGAWMAVEGCHRIRAAYELGLIPEIINISNNKTVSYENRGETVRQSIKSLTEELTDNAPTSMFMSFEEEEW